MKYMYNAKGNIVYTVKYPVMQLNQLYTCSIHTAGFFSFWIEVYRKNYKYFMQTKIFVMHLSTNI